MQIGIYLKMKKPQHVSLLRYKGRKNQVQQISIIEFLIKEKNTLLMPDTTRIIFTNVIKYGHLHWISQISF